MDADKPEFAKWVDTRYPTGAVITDLQMLLKPFSVPGKGRLVIENQISYRINRSVASSYAARAVR